MKRFRGTPALSCAATLALALFALPAIAQTHQAKPATDGPITDGPPADWPITGGHLAGDHFSPLSQINRTNVSHLKVAWQFDTGERGQIQTTPIVIDGVLYAATNSHKIFALNAATGKQIWSFNSGIKATEPNRGLSFWNDGVQGRVLAGVMHFLYELDAKTGKPVLSFGQGGRIDLRNDLDDDPANLAVALTSPGIVFGDVIVVGFRAPETHPAPRGDIRAYDLHTGKLRWTFHTIPHPGEPGYETWPPGAWKDAGAANNWAGMALDSKRGIVYVPTGSAVDDFYGADRVGNDLYANCLLALDVKTGKLLWYFQGTHHDIWDRDFPAAPVLLTVRQGGRSIDAVAQTSKMGFVYVFDRVTGKSLFPIEERPYPASDVPGEVTSPTQPMPLRPAPYARQQVTEDMLTTRTPAAHAWAVKEFQNLRSGGQFLPSNIHTQTIVMPGYDGGAEWGGAAVDPGTGVIYINSNDVANTGGLLEMKPTRGIGANTYLSQCAVCHGAERNGSPPQFPSLVDVDKRLSDTQIEALIQAGKGRMPSFPNIKDEKLHALLAYLRTGKDLADSDTAESATTPHLTTPHTGARGTPGEDKVGAASYASHCAACHGEDGNGMPPAIPSLTGVGQRLEPRQIADIIRNGRDRMPPFPSLPVAETAALLRFLAVDDLAPTQTQSAIVSKKEFEAPSGPAYTERFRFTGYRHFVDPDGYPAIVPPWGTLNAIDLNTGEYLWKIPFGEYPELAAKGMRNTGTESYGGPVVTAGGLVFIAATIFDRKMHAYDSHTGKLLWEQELPFAGLATPATYMAGGRQFVAIASSGGKDEHHAVGGLYIAFALPEDHK